MSCCLFSPPLRPLTRALPLRGNRLSLPRYPSCASLQAGARACHHSLPLIGKRGCPAEGGGGRCPQHRPGRGRPYFRLGENSVSAPPNSIVAGRSSPCNRHILCLINPTGVGKTVARIVYTTAIGKHPHGCGEDILCPTPAAPNLETPHGSGEDVI
jgi:hypothetical protein